MNKEKWEMDAVNPRDYNMVQPRQGRVFILRLTTGADIFLAFQQFAIDNQINFTKIATSFMGCLQPAIYLVWAYDSQNPDNWHYEVMATVQNLSMICSVSGVIHPRPTPGGSSEPFPAIRFVAGGAWDTPTFGGHLAEGSIVKGAFECFITEMLDIEVLWPEGKAPDIHTEEFPESWYKEVKYRL